ncbi:right-handed parallel beta-helix repeat-containing protein [Actinomycetota bacterium]
MRRFLALSTLLAVVIAPTAVVAPAGAAAPLLCDGIPATIVGTPHAEHLVGTASRDVIVARGGDDVIDGRGGNDLICAGGGRDVVIGGGGGDTIHGGSGRDLLRGGSGNDILTGGTGADTLFGGSGNDVLRGSGGTDTLIGNGGIDTATGGQGTDWCRTSETTASCATTVPAGARVAAMAAARVDPTYEHFGFEWKMAGDTDHDSWLFLEYRAVGADRWLPAAPSMRAYPGAIVNGAPLGLNHHAASAMFLRPGTRYEVRATVTDPDGGAATIRRVVRTRRQWYRSGGTIRYVVPGSGGGAGTAGDPYRGLQAAADAARPGDIFEVGAGTYAPFEITTSGTAAEPIRFFGSASGFGTAVIDGAGTDRGVVTIGTFDATTSWIVLHSFVIEDGRWGVDAQNTRNIWVTHNTIRDVDDGVINRRGNAWERNQTVCDNTIRGRTPWPGQGIPGERGIDLRGWGNVVCHNDVADFGDCVSVQPFTGPSFGNDVSGNYAHRCVDDGIEVDYNQRNVRVYDNRVFNARMGVSIQPVAGGPAYIYRNELFNTESKPIKMHNQPSGFFIVNNTGAQNGNAFTGQAGWQNSVLRNNIFLGTRYAFEFTSSSPGGFRDLDYGGWATTRAIDPGGPWFKWDNVRYDRIGDLPAGVEPHGLGLTFAALVDAALPVSWDVEVDPATRDLTLAVDSRAINRGVWVPNLGDRAEVNGRVDLGAHEQGAADPVYGPRD